MAAVFCVANEAVLHSGLDWVNVDTSRVGIYIGVTEHGNVETENEIYEISKFQYDIRRTSLLKNKHFLGEPYSNDQLENTNNPLNTPSLILVSLATAL